jgi:hypothetical protein
VYIGILTEKTLLIFSFFAIFPHLKRQLSLIINELKIEKKHSFPHLSLESPRRPAEQFRKSAISRAESAERCAVKMLACVSETDMEYRFSPTLVNSAFSEIFGLPKIV